MEWRRLSCTDRINGYLDWPYVGMVCRIERMRTIGGVSTTETVHAITSLKEVSARELLRLSREHWLIENSLHWVRDNTFREDACQVKSGNAPELLASVRNLAIGILHRKKHKNIAAALRHHAMNPDKCFAALGFHNLT